MSNNTKQLRSEIDVLDQKISELESLRGNLKTEIGGLEADFVSGKVQAFAIQSKQIEADATATLIKSLESRRDALQSELKAAETTGEHRGRIVELKAAAGAGNAAVKQYMAIRAEFDQVIASFAERMYLKLEEIGENKRTFRTGVQYLTGSDRSEAEVIAEVTAAGVSAEELRVIRDNQVRTLNTELAFGREIAMIEGLFNARAERERQKGLSKGLRLVA